MKLTVLTDDNLSNKKGLLTEHGLCFHIESDGKNILFDMGDSDVFIKNAISLNINLLDLDYIVLSHGHYDHTGGLNNYLAFYLSAVEQGQNVKAPVIVTHPDTFLKKYEEGFGEIGCSISEIKLGKNFELKLTKAPFNLTENLIFLGEIPRLNNFEAKEPIEKVFRDGKYEDDYVVEDSALAYKSKEGLAIITGCSHSGICNIVEHAKKVCNEAKIKSVVGGFHLIDTPKEKMTKIIQYLHEQNITEIYPCHCTDCNAKEELAIKLNAKEIGVGSRINRN